MSSIYFAAILFICLLFVGISTQQSVPKNLYAILCPYPQPNNCTLGVFQLSPVQPNKEGNATFKPLVTFSDYSSGLSYGSLLTFDPKNPNTMQFYWNPVCQILFKFDLTSLEISPVFADNGDLCVGAYSIPSYENNAGEIYVIGFYEPYPTVPKAVITSNDGDVLYSTGSGPTSILSSSSSYSAQYNQSYYLDSAQYAFNFDWNHGTAKQVGGTVDKRIACIGGMQGDLIYVMYGSKPPWQDFLGYSNVTSGAMGFDFFLGHSDITPTNRLMKFCAETSTYYVMDRFKNLIYLYNRVNKSVTTYTPNVVLSGVQTFELSP